MPTVPYRRIGLVEEFAVGQCLVHTNWDEVEPSFYRVTGVDETTLCIINHRGFSTLYSRMGFGPPSQWMLIADEGSPVKTTRGLSGFGKFVQRQKTLDNAPT